MKKIFIALLSLIAISAKAQEKKVLIDNAKIKVTEYVSQPGQDVCGSGKHSHGDHVTILLTNAKVKTINKEGKTEIETYSVSDHLYTVSKDQQTQKVPTDGAFWAKATSHQVTNINDIPLRFYIIETKK